MNTSCFHKIAGAFLLILIRVYQYLLSPLLRVSCRYVPSCSEYGTLAIRKHGPIKGTYLLLKRLIRCRPGGGAGYDPV